MAVTVEAAKALTDLVEQSRAPAERVATAETAEAEW